MNNLLGIGGESLVMKKFYGKGKSFAFKIIPLDGAEEEIIKSIRKNHARIRKALKPTKTKNPRKPTISGDKEPSNKKCQTANNRPETSKTSPPISNPIEIKNKPETSQNTPPIPKQSSRPTAPTIVPEIEIAGENQETSDALNDQAEFECSSIIHPNVIEYHNVTLDIVNGVVCLIAGKSYYLFFLLFIFSHGGF